jgi:hypothetical protein
VYRIRSAYRGIRSILFSALLVTAAGLALTGCAKAEHGAPSTAVTAPEPLPTGACRFVTAAEVAQITGIRTIKPTPVIGGTDACMYFYTVDATIPAWSPGMPVSDAVPPPSVYIAYFTEPVGVNGVERDLVNPKYFPVQGVGLQAVWIEDVDELAVKLQNGVARIDVNEPENGQRLRSDDHKELAITLFRVGEPRMR